MVNNQHKPGILFVPIGDRFTMDLVQAATVTKWISPKIVFPAYFGTLPFLVQVSKGFVDQFGKKCKSKVIILNPGEEVDV